MTKARTGTSCLHKILLTAAISWLGLNSVFAQTWIQTMAPSNNWICIASSADGSKLAAGTWPGLIYTSTNSGITWTPTAAPNEYWSSIASSADGTKLVAAAAGFSGGGSGVVCTSTNSGFTWNSNCVPNEYWGSVASSADGCKLVVVAPLDANIMGPGAIFTSTNSGNDWTSNDVPGFSYPSAVASSADGTKLFLAGGFEVWRSTNSGAAWTLDSTAPFIWGITSPSQFIASSADGNKLVLALSDSDEHGNPGQIYTSTNSGDTWQLSGAPSNQWQSVASSADGNTLLAVPGFDGWFGLIYVSTNSGVSWTTNNSPYFGWGAVASSADGGKLWAAGESDTNNNGAWIYTLQSIHPPSMYIAPTNGILALSWLAPSTNFVLQQSGDLNSWTEIADAPTLNLTSLQDEVFLPPTNGGGFYRLATP